MPRLRALASCCRGLVSSRDKLVNFDRSARIYACKQELVDAFESGSATAGHAAACKIESFRAWAPKLHRAILEDEGNLVTSLLQTRLRWR